MGRYRLFVLIMASALACSGCGEWQTLPVQLYFDTDFSEAEYRAGLDAVGQWNERAGGRYAYGDAVFEVVGRFDDDFNEHDYEDAYHVVYRINEPNPDVRYLQELYANDGGVGGYNTLSDGFIVMYPIDEHIAEIRPQLLQEIEDGISEPYDVEQYLRNLRYGTVHNYVLHELGHMLGLQHYNHRRGVMNSEGGIAWHGIEYLTDADLDAFCLSYDCRYDRED